MQYILHLGGRGGGGATAATMAVFLNAVKYRSTLLVNCLTKKIILRIKLKILKAKSNFLFTLLTNSVGRRCGVHGPQVALGLYFETPFTIQTDKIEFS